MKKSLLALAALGSLAGASFAQSTVTIYGIVDAGLVAESGGAAGSITKLTSGVASASRIGFRGTEDLGGGLSANFVLENGFNVDTGAMGQTSAAVPGGLLFGRQAFVGLKGDFGAVNFGRQYTPHYTTVVAADPFGNGMAGRFSNLMAASGTRMDNTIKYSTPASLGAFSADIAYGFGEVAGNTSGNRAVGFGVGYASGPVYVRLGYHNLNNAAASDNAKNTVLAATYDFTAAKAHFAYGVNKGTGTADNSDLLLGVSVPFGQHKVLASYIRKNDKTAANRDADQWAIGYSYALSKRTDFYAAYARINNKNGATFTVGNNTETGSGDKAFNLGIRHSF